MNWWQRQWSDEAILQKNYRIFWRIILIFNLFGNRLALSAFPIITNERQETKAEAICVENSQGLVYLSLPSNSIVCQYFVHERGY